VCNPGYFRFDDINLELIDVGFQSNASATTISDLTVTNSRLTARKLFDFNTATSLGDLRFMNNGSLVTAVQSTLSGAGKSRFSGNFVSGGLTFAGGEWIVSENTFTTTSTYSGVFSSLVLAENSLVFNGSAPIELNVTGVGNIMSWGNNADAGTQPMAMASGGTFRIAGNLSVTGYLETMDAIPFSVKRFSGSLNGSGAIGIAHGIPAAHLKVLSIQAFYRGPSGEMLPMVINYLDGGALVVSGGSPGAHYRVSLMYTPADDPNW